MMMLAEVIIVVVRGHLSGGQDMTGAAAPTAGAPQGAGTDRNAGSTLTELSGMVAVTEVCVSSSGWSSCWTRRSGRSRCGAGAFSGGPPTTSGPGARGSPLLQLFFVGDGGQLGA